MIRIQRIYEPRSKEDGFRVLVDRLWPRGVAREAAAVDLWLKEIAPSAELRTWFGHDSARWPEFIRRYHIELDAQPAVVKQLRDLAAKGTLTLLYAARDEQHNNAVALREYLTRP